MKRGDSLFAGIALAALFMAVAASVQAQEVHKCTINGSVSYQPMPCPSGDVVLQAPSTPSEQEARQARTDLSRQHVQASSGRLLRPAYVPPRTPPPAPPVTTTTTTTIVMQASDPVVVYRESTSRSRSPWPQRPLTNCEKLDRDNAEAVERREQVRVATDMPSHAQTLQQAEDDLARIRQLAAAGNCRLTR